MSLFGSSRREGVLATLTLALVAFAIHAIGAATGLTEGFEGDQVLAQAMATAHSQWNLGELPLWDPAGSGAPLWTRGAELLYPPWWLLGRGHDAFWLPCLVAAHAALACALAFRFLRAQGRSRYAAFLGGAAYGLGAHCGSLSGNLAELAAIAWAPLSIELFLRFARSPDQRLCGAMIAPALAVAFATGGTVTAGALSISLAVWWIRRAWREPDRRFVLGSAAIATAIAVLLLLAPIWLGILEVPPRVATVWPPAELGATLQRLTGPLLTFFALLGLMRDQRHTPAERWLPIAGIAIVAAIVLPSVPSPFPGPAPWQAVPLALWWPLHLALVVLGASGLDDFLDTPLRRREANAWLLIGSALLAPVGYLLGADTHRFHVEATVLLALALLFTAWRWLGILGFKTVLAAAAMVWLAAATLHEQARANRVPQTMATLLAAPGFESAPMATANRARIEFQVVPAAAASPSPAPLPRVPGASTAIVGLPNGFATESDAEAHAVCTEHAAQRTTYRAELGHGTGVLCLPETYAPGWRATVDGKATPVLCVADGGRAILLGPGSHQVALRYQPLALLLGPQLAAVGVLLTLAWMLGCAVRSWQRARVH